MFVHMLGQQQCVGGQDGPVLPLLLSFPLRCPPGPDHTDHGRVPSGSRRDPKAQDLASHGEHSQRHCNLGQMCKALIFLLKKLWPAALNFSSPAFWTPALWKFASSVQASRGRCWIAGCSRAIKMTLGKAAVPWFSFQRRQGTWKGTSNLQRREEESAKRKTGASPARSQEGLLPAWVGGGGN